MSIGASSSTSRRGSPDRRARELESGRAGPSPGRLAPGISCPLVEVDCGSVACPSVACLGEGFENVAHAGRETGRSSCRRQSNSRSRRSVGYEKRMTPEQLLPAGDRLVDPRRSAGGRGPARSGQPAGPGSRLDALRKVIPEGSPRTRRVARRGGRPAPRPIRHRPAPGRGLRTRRRRRVLPDRQRPTMANGTTAPPPTRQLTPPQPVAHHRDGPISAGGDLEVVPTSWQKGGRVPWQATD